MKFETLVNIILESDADKAQSLRKKGYFVLMNKKMNKLIAYSKDQSELKQVPGKSKIFGPLEIKTMSKKEMGELEQIKYKMKANKRGY
jgi:hypothetical protein